jgi:hypothetical protein
MSITPEETDSPLIVDANGMLSLPVPAQCLQLVPGRRGQNVQLGRGMQLQQFAQRHPLESPEAPGMLIVKQLLGFFGREALDHP